MSTLQVANVHFESTGANRIEYTGNNVVRVQGKGLVIPRIDTANTPSPEPGMMFYNTSTNNMVMMANTSSVVTIPSNTVVDSAYASINAGYTVANAGFAKANAALANTSGVSFAGDLYIPGNLGLGTTTPAYKIDTVGTSSTYLGHRIYNNSTSNSAVSYLQFGNDWNAYAAYIGLNSSLNTNVYGGSNSFNLINYAYGPVLIATNGSERMRIDASGNVSIGSTSTTYKLDINGNANVNGTLAMTTPFSMRNKIINGGFDIWQRATTFTNFGSFSYLVDRWRIGYDGTPPSGRTLTRQTFTPGQTDVPEGDPTYYIEYTFPNCGTPTNYLRTDIEGVRTLAGKKATFSFWARVTSGTMQIGLGIAQEFGTGGSPSAGVYPTPTYYTATTTWKKFVFTTTVPSITGKTIGTNGNDRIWPAVWMPTNAAGTIQFANMQLEEGSVATSFEKRPFAMELAMCQRYFCKSMSYGTSIYSGTFQSSSDSFSGGISAYTTNNGYMSFSVFFPVQMRAIPSLTLYTTSVTGAAVAGKIDYYNGSWLTTNSIVSAEVLTDKCFRINPGGSWSANQAILCYGAYIADAEL